jgi:hypothetical protein
LAGADGFKALLQRAMVLARTEVPALQGITEQAGDSMKRFDEAVTVAAFSGIGNPDPVIVITAHLLELLVTFIGEPLTARLVCDTSRTASFADES